MPDIRPEDLPADVEPSCLFCLAPVIWAPEHDHWHHVNDADSAACHLLRVLILFGAVDA